jgi:hypothetical protein
MSMEETEFLRAEKSLIANAYFRVIAIDHNSQRYISHCDFQQGGVTSLPTFHVTANADYDIICFSYNKATNTLPAFTPARYDDISGINLSGDLENLLWQIQTIHVGTTDPSLSFLLDYKAARVRVVVDCIYNNWTITNIANTMKLNSVALAQSVNLMTGDPSGGSLAEQTVTWPTLSPSNTQTSNPFIVMPTNNSVNLTVSIPVNSISRQTYTQIPTEAGYTGKFTDKLEAGHSYNLLVKLKAPIFAGSNIYWQGNDASGTLFFDDAGSTGNQNIQGLLFKWGSLVGISPTEPTTFSSSVPVYRQGETTPYLSYSTWEAIPYWDSSYGNVITDDYITSFRGDICKRIKSAYRLPKSSELGTTNKYWDGTNSTTVPVAGGWVAGSDPASWPTSGMTNVGNKYGTTPFPSASYGTIKNVTMNNMVLPASGIRHYSEGLTFLSFRGTVGSYWSGSFNDADHARILYFSNEQMLPAAYNPRLYALPIRCVKN